MFSPYLFQIILRNAIKQRFLLDQVNRFSDQSTVQNWASVIYCQYQTAKVGHNPFENITDMHFHQNV